MIFEKVSSAVTRLLTIRVYQSSSKMSSGAAGIDAVEAGKAEQTRRQSLTKAVVENVGEQSVRSDTASDLTVGPEGQLLPTADEMQTLRRVRGKIDFTIYTIAFIELCERFAYYGTTVSRDMLEDTGTDAS